MAAGILVSPDHTWHGTLYTVGTLGLETCIPLTNTMSIWVWWGERLGGQQNLETCICPVQRDISSFYWLAVWYSYQSFGFRAIQPVLAWGQSFLLLSFMFLSLWNMRINACLAACLFNPPTSWNCAWRQMTCEQVWSTATPPHTPLSPVPTGSSAHPPLMHMYTSETAVFSASAEAVTLTLPLSAICQLF